MEQTENIIFCFKIKQNAIKIYLLKIKVFYDECMNVLHKRVFKWFERWLVMVKDLNDGKRSKNHSYSNNDRKYSQVSNAIRQFLA